jgi:hypothetical protein
MRLLYCGAIAAEPSVLDCEQQGAAKVMRAGGQLGCGMQYASWCDAPQRT